MLVSCDGDDESNVNGTIAFVRSSQVKWGAKWLFWSCDTIHTGISITWLAKALSIAPLHLACQNGPNKVKHDFYVNVTIWAQVSPWCNINRIVIGIIASVRLRQLKQSATWLFGHGIPLVLVSALHVSMALSITP